MTASNNETRIIGTGRRPIVNIVRAGVAGLDVRQRLVNALRIADHGCETRAHRKPRTTCTPIVAKSGSKPQQPVIDFVPS